MAAPLALLGSAALSAAPDIVAQVKKIAPVVYKRVASSMQLTGATPEGVAQLASTSKNSTMSGALIESFMRNGLRDSDVARLIPDAQRELIAKVRAGIKDVSTLYDKSAGVGVPTVEGDPQVVAAADANAIESICRDLGIDSNALRRLVVFARTHGPETIDRYRAYEVSRGRQPR